MEGFQSAIIGCGSIFGVHAKAVQQLDEARLAAVVDINETKAAEAAERYNCSSYTDYRQMLQDKQIQVVHICTPHYLHAEMAIAALQSGKHVLVEKPMAITFADAETMIRIARETGKRLGICFQNRYNFTASRIKNLLDSGRAGKVLHAKAAVKWHRDAAYYQNCGWKGKWATEGGGVLINQAIHTLDLLQWFLGEITSITGAVATTGLRNIIEVEDTAEAVIKFKNGVTADFFATNCHPVDEPVELEIECEQLNLKLAGELMIQSRDGQVERVAEVNTRTGAKAYWGCSHAALIADFYGHLGAGEPFLIDGASGSIALRMVRTIYHSAKCQSEVWWNEKLIL
ncbi:MAG TPA: Gfo/Idh/MocA family oxidoreductase [Bacillota bacterium]|nr:Gfo/Idh/MocA family oxidoreductase [Bacillota bacterium]